MFKKQKLLLGVLDFLQERGRASKLELVKVMFLLSKEKPPKFSMYSFHPYKFGPYSSKIYSDMYYLEKQGLVTESENAFSITNGGKMEKEIPGDYFPYLNQVLERFPTVEDLIDYIYQAYPEYAVKSERRNIPIKIKLDSTPSFFLIGYEGRNIDDFLNELILKNIQVLIDVRKNPRSMKYEFNKKRLENSLKHIGVKYVHVPELGIESERRKELVSKADYEKLFEWYAKQLPDRKEYLMELVNIQKGKRVALMCLEADYTTCHRREIGKYLRNEGHPVGII